MGIRVKRKLFRSGQSRAVTLPSGWIAYYGNRVDVVTILGSDLLIVVPQGLEKRAEEVAAFLDCRAEGIPINSIRGGLKS